MIQRTLPLTALLLLPLGACATIVNDGAKDELALLSDPKGATYELSTGGTGTTPAWVEVKPQESMFVTYRLEGYEPKTVQLSRKIRTLTWANFAWLVGGLIPAGIAFGVDFGTGAAWKFEQPLTVKLTPVGEAAAP